MKRRLQQNTVCAVFTLLYLYRLAPNKRTDRPTAGFDTVAGTQTESLWAAPNWGHSLISTIALFDLVVDLPIWLLQSSSG